MGEKKEKRRKQSRLARQIIWLRSALSTFVPWYGSSRQKAFSRRLQSNTPLDLGGADVILAACDDRYFDLFAVDLIKSVSAVQEMAIHLHLLDPSPETIERTEILRKEHRCRLTYTIDNCLDAHNANAKRIYFASARFIVAPLLIDAGAKRLLIIDVDTVMRHSPWPGVDEWHDASVGLMFRESYRRWQRILAGCVFLNSDSYSRKFARRFARALLVNVSRRQEYYVDQIVAHYLVQLSDPTLKKRIKALPTAIMSLSYAEEAAFWTAKGGEKFSPTFGLVQAGQSISSPASTSN
jgi:hypothetical protein